MTNKEFSCPIFWFRRRRCIASVWSKRSCRPFVCTRTWVGITRNYSCDLIMFTLTILRFFYLGVVHSFALKSCCLMCLRHVSPSILIFFSCSRKVRAASASLPILFAEKARDVVAAKLRVELVPCLVVQDWARTFITSRIFLHGGWLFSCQFDVLWAAQAQSGTAYVPFVTSKSVCRYHRCRGTAPASDEDGERLRENGHTTLCVPTFVPPFVFVRLLRCSLV